MLSSRVLELNMDYEPGLNGSPALYARSGLFIMGHGQIHSSSTTLPHDNEIRSGDHIGCSVGDCYIILLTLPPILPLGFFFRSPWLGHQPLMHLCVAIIVVVSRCVPNANTLPQVVNMCVAISHLSFCYPKLIFITAI